MDIGKITFNNSGSLANMGYGAGITASVGVIQQRPSYQQRVIDEKAELAGRIVSLAAFIETFDKPHSVFAMLPEQERMRLYAQHRVMVEYCAILDERIAAF